MKIAVGAMSHETNTFAMGTTSLETFDTAVGSDLLTTDRVGRSIGGIVETLDDAGVEILPTVGASALPAPTVETEAYEWMKREFLDALDGESVDGVCLDLHGSMFVADEPDPEGNLLAAIRNTVGPNTMITAALDMHATVTERMVEHLDGVAGYRTAPHTDVVETGVRAATLLLDALNGDTDLALGWEPFPMLLAGERSESEAEPMCTLVGLLEDADGREGVYDANYFLGFPWADSPHAGCHALVTGAAGAQVVVEEVATDLAEEFWRRRDEFDFTTEAYDPGTALDEAAETDARPVVVADTGDIPGAGAGENTTNLLAAMLARDDLGTPLVAVVADVECYEACREAGRGEDVRLSLGRLYPSGEPLETTGTPVAFREEEGAQTVLVSLDGVDVIVADRRTNVHRDPEFVRRLGVDPATRAVIALKSGYLSPAWKEAAARRLFALTPGETNQQLADLPYERVPRPTYPLDEDATWQR
ncbi:M81 family metallopeptidase [Halogeometricum sp. S1BR25-6]|uniref:M81 family metallopeptidase n=1 Tax=Halogeometricum salsisoli TaxID=2950536 RepID=A0ABU2GK11_9EURY|nr:M81 family metallopeptidase [Halogeometricum sp. S1BR25-6]MDS0301139.1 M81 family metallopeptidase [Halogeometricum sp. S1BR25-6]